MPPKLNNFNYTQNIVTSLANDNHHSYSFLDTVQSPKINYPKDGAGIKVIDGKFEENSMSWIAAFSIPLPIISSYGSYKPSIDISYNSVRCGNSLFSKIPKKNLVIIIHHHKNYQ